MHDRTELSKDEVSAPLTDSAGRCIWCESNANRFISPIISAPTEPVLFASLGNILAEQRGYTA